MIIENYTQKFETPAVDLWNQCCFFDPVDVEKFRRQALFDENFDPSLAWVAREGDHLAGFVYGTKRKFPYLERGLEPDRGWINVIFVHPEYRRMGIGQALYGAVEKELRKRGCRNITAGAYSPNYFFWGIDPDHYSDAVSFFETNGYKSCGEHYSMGKDLHGYRIPEEIIAKKKAAEGKGYRFMKFDYGDSLELLDFLKEEFGGGWKRSALIAMQNGCAEDLILIIRNPSDRICGFCMRAIDGNPMRFGPVGVSESERNLGLGTILLDLQC